MFKWAQNLIIYFIICPKECQALWKDFTAANKILRGKRRKAAKKISKKVLTPPPVRAIILTKAMTKTVKLLSL